MAQLRDQGSSDVPPAFSDNGSKPAPMPALEQNSAIGPNCFSVSDDVADVFLLPDVAFERRTVDRGRHTSCTCDIDVGDDHLRRTGAMENLAKRPADTVGTAGDDYDFAVHLHRGIRFFNLLRQNHIKHGRIMAGRAQ